MLQHQKRQAASGSRFFIFWICQGSAPAPPSVAAKPRLVAQLLRAGRASDRAN